MTDLRNDLSLTSCAKIIASAATSGHLSIDFKNLCYHVLAAIN